VIVHHDLHPDQGQTEFSVFMAENINSSELNATSSGPGEIVDPARSSESSRCLNLVQI
jgi:hypothetical protein